MATPSTGLTFGTSPGLSFGGTTQAQPAGFTFGTSTPATGGFSFGTPATTTQATSGLTFGTPAQTTGFTLGGTTPATTASQSTGLFGQPSGFSFGATTSSFQPLTFAKPTTSSLSTFGSTTQPQQTGFSFGSTPLVTTQSGLTFGTTTRSFTTPATQTPGFFSSTTTSSGLFSSPKPTFGTAPTTTNLFGQKPATTPPSLGGNLGGEVTHPSLIKAVKDNPIPPEMMQLVDSFKNVVKEQKNNSSEIARCSLKPLQKTSDDIESIKHLLIKLERSVNINKSMIIKLKADSARCVRDCEMAQRTMELSAGFQSDNVAPLDYFTQLADRFQEQVVHLRVEIENTEKHIHSALNPTALSPQELNASMTRLHECFVALAGRLQLVHSSMSNLKQNHLEMRRKKTNDFSDIFDRKQVVLKAKNELVSGGPLTANSLYWSVAALVQSKVPDDKTSQVFGPPSTQPSQFSQQPTPSTTVSPNVQLKSPPGTKRGKR